MFYVFSASESTSSENPLVSWTVLFGCQHLSRPDINTFLLSKKEKSFIFIYYVFSLNDRICEFLCHQMDLVVLNLGDVGSNLFMYVWEWPVFDCRLPF